MLRLTDLNYRKFSISKLFYKIHIHPEHYVRNVLQNIKLGCTQCYTTRGLKDSFPNQIVLPGILEYINILSPIVLHVNIVHSNIYANLYSKIVKTKPNNIIWCVGI